MGKKLSIERIRLVINALREGNKTWSDLKNLKPEIPDKTLERILKEYLGSWGLAKKENDCWVWYEYSRVFQSKHDYELAIEHSRKLLPAFESIIKMTENFLQFAAEEHLKSYPKIYENLKELRELQEKQDGKLYEKIKDKIITPDKMWVMNFEKRKGEGLLSRIFGETVLVKKNIPYVLGPFEKIGEVKEITEMLGYSPPFYGTKKGYFIHGPIEMAMFEDLFGVYRELSGELSLLMRRIEHGEPLEGKCSLCPKITIIEKKGVES